MNYTYFNKKESEVIKNYKTNEDKIVIRLLSGDYYEIPLSKENEKKIIEEVLYQAEERNNYGSYIAKVKRRRFYHSILSILFSLFAGYDIYNVAQMDSKEKKLAYGLLAVVNAIFIVVNGVQIILKSDELDEIKKYGIYLDIREKLETYKHDSNLFNKIKGRDSIPTINTLDDWYTDEIVQLRNNLKLCERYECFCKQAGPKKI